MRRAMVLLASPGRCRSRRRAARWWPGRPVRWPRLPVSFLCRVADVYVVVGTIVPGGVADMGRRAPMADSNARIPRTRTVRTARFRGMRTYDDSLRGRQSVIAL